MALTKISTDGVKDDAVTAGKIPANAVGSSELSDNSVDTNAIQDQAVTLSKLPHGDSNNNGKFLRANNGADPSFETVSIPAGTTINGNTDHRVITATGTANTLQGESGLTYNGSTLGVSGSVAMTGGSLSLDGHPLVGAANFTDISGGSYAARLGSTGSSTIRSTQIYGGGSHIATFDGVNNRLGIGTTTPNTKLEIAGSTTNTLNLSDGQVQIVGNNPIAFVSQSNLNPALNRWGFKVRANSTDGSFSIYDYANSRNSLLLDSSGNVNISSGYLSLPDESSGSQFRLGAGNDFQIEHDGSNTYLYNLTNDLVIQNDAAVKITAKAGGTQRFRFDTDGLKFGTDSAAANALDDYEQGICSSIGITTANTGYVRKTGGTVYYTKIGRVVHLYGNFQCNEFANYFGGNVLQIAGFPYTSSGYGNSSDIMIAIWGGSYNWWEEGYPSINMENNNTTHDLYSHRTPGSSGLGQYAAVSGSNMGAGSAQFNFDLIYFTDA